MRAFIPLQTPYGGTPLVSDIKNSKGLDKVAMLAIQHLFKGEEAAMSDLSYKHRQKYLAKFPFDARRVRTVAVSSTCDKSQTQLLSPVAHFIHHKHNLESDGAVPREDARFPGADFVNLAGLDHGATVYQIGKTVPSPAEIMFALIVLALK